jgi:hypothetical protein
MEFIGVSTQHRCMTKFRSGTQPAVLMLRQAQHERQIRTAVSPSPVRLEPVEG